jgi:hypothetical protein
MNVETNEEKTERMFRYYKNNLLNLTNVNDGNVRFICIEYVCRFPNINPFEMAASLLKDGIGILYDDSSINQSENRAKERKVNKLLKEAY